MELYRHKAQYYETDQMGVVHHSNYIRWMEEARIDFFTKIGWDYKKLEDSGVISPVTAVECKYKVSTYFSEVVTIEVNVTECKGVKLKLRYAIRKEDGTLASEGYSEHCFLTREGRIVNLKKEHPAFFEALTGMIMEGEK